MSVSSLADGIPQRRKLQLQPRSHVLASETGSVRDDGGSAQAPSEAGEDETTSNAASTTAASAAATTITVDQAKRKVKEDVKEFLLLRSLGEGEGYFTSLPPEFRWHLVEELVHKAIDAKASDVQLVCDLLSIAASKSLVDEAQFARGFAVDIEYLEDTSTDSPSAYGNVASLLKAANVSQATVERYDLSTRCFVDEADLCYQSRGQDSC
jgi:translation initiation factor 4G